MSEQQQQEQQQMFRSTTVAIPITLFNLWNQLLANDLNKHNPFIVWHKFVALICKFMD
ncbi:MAG: hypothetical protein JO327_05310 [Nitrososphaeraceae archaeon]|nr:hypothetical protein [Nitrososphaeraceae archaeon]